jgi:hypothetical protein
MLINELISARRSRSGVEFGIGGRFRAIERVRRATRIAAAVVLGLTFTAAPGYADPRSELAHARHDLAISEQVLARMTERMEIARLDPATGPEQRQRLDEYVARVRELVASNRERVRSLTEAVAAAPGGAPSLDSGSKSPPAAATHGEEVAALENKLGGSLAEFDQLLLEEARRAETRRTNGGSGSRGEYGEGGAAGTQASKGSTAGSKTPGAAGAGGGSPAPERPGDKAGSPGGPTDGKDPGTAGATAAVPPDVGDGNDDDVVARQIRKAAETEPDPELRKRLWDEYRKYKQGARG